MTRTTLPIALPGGDLMPHMSARMRTRTMDTIWEMVGGTERAVAWVEANDENYGEFFKLWAKGAAKPISVEHSASEGVEALLDKLDVKERAVTINADAVDITPLDSE